MLVLLCFIDIGNTSTPLVLPPKGSEDDQENKTCYDDRYLRLYIYEGIEQQPVLAEVTGKILWMSTVRGIMRVCLLPHITRGNVSGGHVNITGRLIHGGMFSSRMESLFLVQNDIRRCFTWWVQKRVIIHQTFVKNNHTEEAVSVFDVASLWTDTQTSMSLHVEQWMLTSDAYVCPYADQ